MSVAARGWVRRHPRVLALFLLGLLVGSALFLGLLRFAVQLPEPGGAETAKNEAIVVLTGGARRLAAGLQLLQAGGGQRLLVSGVHRGVEVGELLAHLKTRPTDLIERLDLGHQARNTRGNAREAAAWVAEKGYRSLTLVTADYHMPRALLEFRAAMPDLAITAHAVESPGFRRDAWWRSPGSARLLISEYLKGLVTRLRFALMALEPAS